MNKYSRKVCACLGISFALVTGFSLQQSTLPLYAENVNLQDAINISVQDTGDSIQLELSGTLTQSSWWYLQKNITLNYSDGQTKELECILEPGHNRADIKLGWGILNATADLSDLDADNGSFKVVYTIQKTDISGATGITADGQQIDFSNETDNPSDEDNPGEDNNVQVSLIPNVNGKIAVDGKTSDWAGVKEIESANADISLWKMARDTSGNLYVMFEGKSITEWYGGYLDQVITIEQNGSYFSSQVRNISDKAYVNEAHQTTAGPYHVEFCIPASQFTSDTFTVNFAGVTVNSSEIGILDGNDVTPPEDNTYKGIVIDGKFDDWNAVTKYDAKCPNTDHPNCLESTAVVFDGDYVYIYIKDGPGGDASGAGTHSNGNWAITTDLGRTLMLKLNKDGSVTSKAAGIQSIHVGSQWEIAVPASELPNYKKSINWGLYGVDKDSLEPFVTNVSNLNGNPGPAGEEDPIAIDGNYGDWDNYPTTYYEHATNGNQGDVIDSETSITSVGKTLYQYVTTEMPEHIMERGGGFTSGITVRLNQNDNYRFSPRFVAVDSQGNINWNPQLSGLASGTYSFELVDSQGRGDSPTLAELEKYGNAHYGTMIITIGEDGKDSCEYSLDLEKVANKFGLNADDITMVETNFGRLGNQWARITGASSGPWTGAGIAAGIAAIAYIINRKRMI